MSIQGLDKECPACGKVTGDHTVREWAQCTGEYTELPYEPIPEDAVEVANAELRRRFSLEDDVIIADQVVIRAATLDGAAGVVGIKMPALIHEFSTSAAGIPHTVAKVLFLAEVDGMRSYGRLVRDCANGAANQVDPKA